MKDKHEMIFIKDGCFILEDFSEDSYDDMSQTNMIIDTMEEFFGDNIDRLNIFKMVLNEREKYHFIVRNPMNCKILTDWKEILMSDRIAIERVLDGKIAPFNSKSIITIQNALTMLTL